MDARFVSTILISLKLKVIRNTGVPAASLELIIASNLEKKSTRKFEYETGHKLHDSENKVGKTHQSLDAGEIDDTEADQGKPQDLRRSTHRHQIQCG